MKPKKSLGQNFLTSIPARLAITKAGNLDESDTVLEIGPGKGFLTEELLKTKAKVVAVEKDDDLLGLLTEKFKDFENDGKFTLISKDILDFSPENEPLLSPSYKVVANIPYYITGAILQKFLTSSHPPTTLVVLVQEEVAKRVVARDGKESILSLSVKAYGTPALVYKVNRGSFNPIPNVDSGVLQVTSISKHNFKNKSEEDLFFQLVKAGFAHKRKFLLNNLKEVFPDTAWKELFKTLSLDEKSRAETLPLATWLQIMHAL